MTATDRSTGTYDPSVVLPYGARVRMTSYDAYGLLGRDLHPTEADVGFEGVVVRNVVELRDGERVENERPGVATPEEAIVIYWVISPMGRTLEVASYEITPVESAS